MKTRNKVTCQGVNGRSVWLQWITDQFRRHDCTRETIVSIEYADTDDSVLEPKQKSTLEDCVNTLQAAIRADHGQVVMAMNLMAVANWIREVAEELEPRPLLTASVEMPRKRGE